MAESPVRLRLLDNGLRLAQEFVEARGCARA